MSTHNFWNYNKTPVHFDGTFMTQMTVCMLDGRGGELDIEKYN